MLCKFKGNTEREFLENIESIVQNSLPHEKLKIYCADFEAAKTAILNKVTFCCERTKVGITEMGFVNNPIKICAMCIYSVILIYFSCTYVFFGILLHFLGGGRGGLVIILIYA